MGSAVLVLNEWAVVSWLARGQFAGPWETREGIWALAPLTWIQVAPIALAFAAALVVVRVPRRGARTGVALLAAAAAMAVAFGVSHGRHFAAAPVRALFIAALGGAGFGLVWALGVRVARAVDDAPQRSAVAAVLLAVLAEAANHRILPGLYPAFHFALTALTAMTAYVIGHGLGFFASLGDSRKRAAWGWGGAFALLLLAGIARAPAMARRPLLTDNVRLTFLERATLMGLGVELASKLAPAGEAAAAAVSAGPATKTEQRLSVDFRGRDILVISVDALRADHVGAYGYGRGTSPHLDALAREGTTFLHAYCPTPHTSYSIASMMTGKALRPLLTHGLGSDSDTLAGLLRTYGYRTAAFYPPAVFFVDGELFTSFQERKLDFEYARVEFAAAPERARAVRSYLAVRPNERLLLWVHLFEPHEPYVVHPEHEFGERDVDRYDGEIALADDGIGEIVAAVRSARPHAVIVATADHGEAFGEHGGRYHGTAVYEEQVRVPLVVVAPGLPGGRRIAAPVQTIDILPTILAALDIPRPPRVDGNDLGPWLRADAGKLENEVSRPAFAETEEQVLLADGAWRLICTRRASACALYDVARDPGELEDVAREHGARFASMKAALRQMEASHGRYESNAMAGARPPWPDAIRRGMAKDGDAALELAALLDDSDREYRRKAAELLFDLKREEARPALTLTLARDDDAIVKSYCALALTRLGHPVPEAAELLRGGDESWRRLAALSFAENGDRRGAGVLASWWQSDLPPFERARDLLAAMGRIQAKEAVPALIGSLDDVRFRPYVAETLATIGQTSARAPLLERFVAERYQNARVALGEALVRLGAKNELVEPLLRFLGTPDPLPNGLDLALRAGILARVGGPAPDALTRSQGQNPVTLSLAVPAGGNGRGRRLLLRAHLREGERGELRVSVDGNPVATFAVAPGPAAEQATALGGTGPSVQLSMTATGPVTVDAVAVVPLADDLPPPPPEPWSPSLEEPPPGAPVARVPPPD